MSIFDIKNETMPRDRLEQFQLERIQALASRLRRNVRRYREALGDLKIETLADLDKVPPTTPEDLVAAFPYGLFALPLREIIRLHSSVGPDGKQIVVGHTRNDLTHWGRLVARQLVAAGVTAHDVIQICFGGSLFEQAYGYVLGAGAMEASVISEDLFHIDYELSMLQNCHATALITTPGNARKLMELVAVKRIDPQSLRLRSIILSRPVSAEERDALKTGLFADVWTSFGVAEVLEPGLCVECEKGCFHVNEDQFFVEVKDGELLVTTLCREAVPLLRYKTRIACSLKKERCACARTGVILVPGQRLDDRLRVNEKPFYPAQIKAMLAQTKAANWPFHLDISEHRVLVSLEAGPELFLDTVKDLVKMKYTIESEFQSRLGIEAVVTFKEPKRK